MSGTVKLADLALPLARGPRWAMVRTHFGITAFGVNAYSADEAGTDVIGEHDELGEGSGEHEELYFVAKGHATFTVNGDEIDAPAGTFVFVRDPAAKRRAVATEAGTTAVVVGGTPGKAFTPSPWERTAPALAYFGAGEYDKAVDELERLQAESPERPGRALQPRLRREHERQGRPGSRAPRRARSSSTQASASWRRRTPISTRSATTRDSSQRSPGSRTPAARARSAGTGSASGRATSMTAP